MTETVFLIDGDELREMQQEGYESEARLQELLARFPRLLGAGEGSWLLVGREVGIPGVEGGGDRWAVDHLFLDAAGVPTLVEVKRSTDTRIRREVVGQMLDYAANAVMYWPIERIQQSLATRLAEEGQDQEQVFRERFGIEDVGGFWERVKTNLQAGRMRLLFVADVIPAELRRIVEFLNEQMDPAEVLAVEVRRYASDGIETLVPRVFGQSAQAERRKGSGWTPGEPWTEERFFAELEQQAGTGAVEVARRIYSWAEERGLECSYGRGKTEGSITFGLRSNGTTYWPLVLLSYGKVGVQLRQLMYHSPFDDEEARMGAIRRLNEMEWISFDRSYITRRPAIALNDLAAGNRLQEFLDVIDWIVEQIRGGTTADA